MATVVYPAIVERAGDTFSVYFPDLAGLTSAGSTVNDAVINAEEALSEHLVLACEHGEEVPAPSDIADIERDPEVDEVARILVRAEAPGKSVRLNITLDEGLVSAIDRVARNRSVFLAEAARELLAHRRKLEAA